jgi:chitinase
MLFLPSITFASLIFAFLAHSHPHHGHSHARLHRGRTSVQDSVCVNPTNPFDYSVKTRVAEGASTCPGIDDLVPVLAKRDDDYSCSESKPCSNGACCSKKTGYCNYGPEACGPNGINNVSPNAVCWSNCDAVAECGRYANPAGKKCPLNVCCSEFG